MEEKESYFTRSPLFTYTKSPNHGLKYIQSKIKEICDKDYKEWEYIKTWEEFKVIKVLILIEGQKRFSKNKFNIIHSAGKPKIETLIKS